MHPREKPRPAFQIRDLVLLTTVVGPLRLDERARLPCGQGFVRRCGGRSAGVVGILVVNLNKMWWGILLQFEALLWVTLSGRALGHCHVFLIIL